MAHVSQVTGLAEELATLQSSSTRATVELKTANRKVAQLEKKLAEAEAEQAAAQKAIDELKENFSGLDEGAKAVNEEMKKAQTLMEEQEERMTALQSKVDAATAIVSNLKSSMIDVEHDLGEKERALRDHTAAAKQWEKKLSGLKLHKCVDGFLGRGYGRGWGSGRGGRKRSFVPALHPHSSALGLPLRQR